jgi:hypothetical protein
MPKGGIRPGAGAPRGNSNRAKGLAAKAAAEAATPGGRPKFASAREFGLWAINAPDDVVPIDLKMRAMQVMAPLEAKAVEKPEAQAAPTSGKYAPRQTRAFGVVSGGRT